MLAILLGDCCLLGVLLWSVVFEEIVIFYRPISIKQGTRSCNLFIWIISSEEDVRIFSYNKSIGYGTLWQSRRVVSVKTIVVLTRTDLLLFRVEIIVIVKSIPFHYDKSFYSSRLQTTVFLGVRTMRSKMVGLKRSKGDRNWVNVKNLITSLSRQERWQYIRSTFIWSGKQVSTESWKSSRNILHKSFMATYFLLNSFLRLVPRPTEFDTGLGKGNSREKILKGKVTYI